MRKNIQFYTIAVVLLVALLFYFNSAYRELIQYSELKSRSNRLLISFENISTEIKKAAVLEPGIYKSTLRGSALFFTDTSVILQQLKFLRETVADTVNVRIARDLDSAIRSEILWILNSNVPDSIRQQKALNHIQSYILIDSLINQGIARTLYLLEFRKNRIQSAIEKVRLWMIVFVVIAVSLILYTSSRMFLHYTLRKRKEKELEMVLNRISDGVVSFDRDWRYTYINDAALPAHPKGRENTIGKNLWMINPELGKTFFGSDYEGRMETTGPFELENYYSPNDSWYSIKGYPSDDGLTVFYKDISESRRSEQKLTKTLKEVSDYKYALDESAIVAITDQKGMIKYVNDNFCKISKYSREELLGQDHRIINSGYHSKEFIRSLWVTIANGKIWKGELRNKAQDGTIYWVDTTIIPFLNEENKPYQYVAIRADITERKLAEEKLQRSLNDIANYKYALDESSILAITNQKGIITHVNDNFCKISKYSREELLGQDHRIINSGYHSESFIRDLWVTIANGKIWRGELRNRAKDGTIYWVDTTIVPLLDEKGKPYQYIAIRADITERKNAEAEIIQLNADLEEKVTRRTQELQAANYEMEAFTYSVSHDLRAPLRGIIGFTSILEEDYSSKLDKEAMRITGIIKENTLKMGHLIDDLLDFSRMGKKELTKGMVNTNQVVSEVITELKQQSNGKTTEWNISPLPLVKGDISMIRQVWVNLLSNAIKYSSSKDHPKVEIDSFSENGHIVFRIKDNGVGFDEQYAHKLFKVFQRLHDAEEFEGTGVGLALVEKIVSRHGGRTWAKGKEDEGATFYFSLPT
jgi:PAS domain S-box-containing protein